MTNPAALTERPGAILHPTADAGFAVYVHWPFCLAKCPYCDFNSHVRHAPPDQARYVAAFRREIAHRAELTPGRTVSSIFFGGGTPSLMEGRTVGAILDAIGEHWAIDPACEVSLEANPTSVEAGRFQDFRAAGVNRVSLGVQALNDADLKALGRMHSTQEALDAVAIARKYFERYSFDLIYARSVGQTPALWRAELELAISHAAEHLSLYQLTIEPDTAFERLFKAGKLAIPDHEAGAALYEVTQEITAKHGMPVYEISNHAKPGAECRHNLVYWRYGEYAGIGPGAHGRLVTTQGRMAHSTEKSPEAWLTRVEAEGHALVEDELLNAEAQGDEYLLMGLRLVEGIDPAVFKALSGRSLREPRVTSLILDGLLTRKPGGKLAATPDGALLLNALVADLAA
ncbi:radical SAM family heme chaperone HemW [Bosea psychrotolerans]|uniref:Heme chaperone HemW n=1 Tax=Bosea psychrotolerans TaxID=1871628 RepID=A0A2S4ME78_9HYPH|nr:radical SAM family heme chaperone HemW [Bosea psychrotolerans]POR53058.1 oxygen-independent coproporphyrinogen-3 oxidase [Bosea psychrotolerans]